MPRSIDKLRQNAVDGLKAIVPLPVRRVVVRSRLTLRTRTSSLRTLPDFLIIGGQRCGTSSLYKWLSRHPRVAPSLRKEIEYFSTEYSRGEGWYRAHFPVTLRRALARRVGRAWQTFEATPDYLFDPRAPERAANLVPDAKLIVMLREPASRSVSHYHHSVRNNLEDLSLEDALRSEHDRLAPEWGRIESNPDYPALPFRRFSYVARSRYAEQLERWRKHFPSHQMLVVRSEDLFAQPHETFARILEFLGLPAWEPPEFRNYSYTNALDGSYDPPGAWVDEFLAEHLEASNQQLVDLLGEDFSWPRH